MVNDGIYPDGYAEALAEAKKTIQAARTRAVLAVNSGLISLYWDLGELILDRQRDEGWGAKVIRRLSDDLRAAFPGMTGLSTVNLGYMRRMAAEWRNDPISPQLVGKLPWGHHRVLLDRLDDQETRVWYAEQAIENGWSRALLEHQIMGQLHRRVGMAPSNFTRFLPADDSELMQQITRDPYNLEFVQLTAPAAERELESALVAKVDRFLRELGKGFAYVGRQYRLDIDGDEFFIDLLMFHADSNRYVVIELKTKKLTPADVGQLNFYVAVVDDTLRQPHHAETVGLLLCASRNEQTVRYALGRSTSPMAIAGYRFEELPALEKQSMPGEQELIELVGRALQDE
jgi:predicted nuclease of restriction endonuclease-like (RecB) superfamily